MRLLISSVVLLAFSGSLASAQAAPANLLRNGSFEQADGRGGAAHWVVKGRFGSAVVLDAATAADGQVSLRLSGVPGGGTVNVVSDPVKVKPGQTYLLEWSCKTKDVWQSAAIGVVVGGRPRRWDGTAVGGTTDWVHRRSVLTPREGENSLAIRLSLRNRGTAWFDSVSLTALDAGESLSPGFERAVFRLPAKGPLKVWGNYPVLKVFLSDPLPAEQPAKERLEIALARNERESAQLLLESAQEVTIREVRLEPTPGAHLPAGLSMSWNVVNYVEIEREAVHDPGGRPGPNPDPLLPPVPVTVKPGERAALYLTFSATADCPAGQHPGAIVLAGEPTVRVPVVLRVWNFALPDKPTIRVSAHARGRAFERYDPRGGEKAHADWLELAADCHVNPSTELTQKLQGAEWIKLEHGRPVIDWAAFDAVAGPYFDRGFDVLTLPPQNLRTRGPRGKTVRPWLGLPVESAEFAAAFEDYWRQVGRHLRDQGWLERCHVYLWDEPNEREYEPLIRLLELVHQGDPGLLRAAAGYMMPVPELYGHVDVWTTNLRWYSVVAVTDRVAERQAAGDEVGAYGNNRYQLQYPISFMRNWFWLLFRYGFQHTGYWSVNAWRTNPWVTLGERQEEPGAGFLLYPAPAEGYRLCSSLRWEAVRDGMEDFEYLRLYAQAVSREKAQELASRAVWGSMDWEFERDITKQYKLRREMAEAIEGAGH